MKKIFSISLALVITALSSFAQQPQGERPAPPKMRTPAEMAKEKADMMQAEVSLDAKQYKKVYNLFKKDFTYRQQQAKENMPGGMPPQGGGSGMGGHGGEHPHGGPGMGGGNFGGGMPGGGNFGGGMPGGGMPGGGPGMGGGNGEHPHGGPGMGPGESSITEEYLEKQDAKLKKIITADQYSRWRAKHPAEHLELPPMEMEAK